MDFPLVNSWTEFGDLEYICIGNATNAHYPDVDPFYSYNVITDSFIGEYIGRPVGKRPAERIAKAQDELQHLAKLIEGENVKVATISAFDADVKQELLRKRCYLSDSTHPATEKGDKRIQKEPAKICWAPDVKMDHLLMTPWFKNYYQFGLACPRDVVITMGNTILETPTASRVRYFESCYYRDIIYSFWNKDQRIHWKTGPQPTCGPSMFDPHYWDDEGEVIKTRYATSGYKTSLNETELAFDAADMMRVGKDVFYKKSASANNKGIEWLRREFPDLRFHMMHFPNDGSPHLDVNVIPIRPPSSGSDGIVLINQHHPPLAAEMVIFEENGWKPFWSPLPSTHEVPPVAVCSPSLNLNLLCLSTKCCVIEECEIPLYHFLEDLGFDVITCPLRSLNEFGGGVHCVTWDIRRRDQCKDYFPIQDYDTECAFDLNNFLDSELYSKVTNEAAS